MNKLENSYLDENRDSIEKEPKPEKIIIFVRHPSVQWFDKLLDRAISEGKDMETYVPIDKDGLKLANLLSDSLISPG